jgi:hypothetical protein
MKALSTRQAYEIHCGCQDNGPCADRSHRVRTASDHRIQTRQKTPCSRLRCTRRWSDGEGCCHKCRSRMGSLAEYSTYARWCVFKDSSAFDKCPVIPGSKAPSVVSKTCEVQPSTQVSQRYFSQPVPCSVIPNSVSGASSLAHLLRDTITLRPIRNRWNKACRNRAREVNFGLEAPRSRLPFASAGSSVNASARVQPGSAATLLLPARSPASPSPSSRSSSTSSATHALRTSSVARKAAPRQRRLGWTASGPEIREGLDGTRMVRDRLRCSIRAAMDSAERDATNSRR